MPDLLRVLPMPRPVFLEDESATPLQGFPVLLSAGLLELRARSAASYIDAEEVVQVAGLRREGHDVKAHTQAWERYAALLSRAVENATISSYGRQYPAVFWLHHSLDVARLLQGGAETNPQAGQRDRPPPRRRHQVPHPRPLPRPRPVGHLRPRAAARRRHRGGRGGALPPPADPPARQRPAVHRGLHRPRPRRADELLQRLAGDRRPRPAPAARRAGALALRAARRPTPACAPPSPTCSSADPRNDGRELLARPGYVAYLATLRAYDPERLLPPPLVQVWESLLVKLKEFELVHALRRHDRADRGPRRRHGRARAAARAGGAPRGGELRLSAATRPLDFMEPWVVDPRVERYGMIYDISDFSATLSVLHRAGNASQEGAFLAMFRFQRRINRLAVSHRAKLEKYLGDGAFYSSREATNLLLCLDPAPALLRAGGARGAAVRPRHARSPSTTAPTG